MKNAKLIRQDFYPDATYGTLYTPISTLATLERPWDYNKPNISCIPVGTYTVSRNKTGRFQYYEVMHVSGRTHIEIHPANFPHELAGCIAVGLDVKYENRQRMLTDSKKACEELLNYFGDEDWQLIIEEDYIDYD